MDVNQTHRFGKPARVASILRPVGVFSGSPMLDNIRTIVFDVLMPILLMVGLGALLRYKFKIDIGTLMRITSGSRRLSNWAASTRKITIRAKPKVISS